MFKIITVITCFYFLYSSAQVQTENSNDAFKPNHEQLNNRQLVADEQLDEKQIQCSRRKNSNENYHLKYPEQEGVNKQAQRSDTEFPRHDQKHQDSLDGNNFRGHPGHKHAKLNNRLNDEHDENDDSTSKKTGNEFPVDHEVFFGIENQDSPKHKSNELSDQYRNPNKVMLRTYQTPTMQSDNEVKDDSENQDQVEDLFKDDEEQNAEESFQNNNELGKTSDEPQTSPQTQSDLAGNCDNKNLQSTRRANTEENLDGTVSTDDAEAKQTRKMNYPNRFNTNYGPGLNLLADPARDAVVPMSSGGVNLWEHSRVCYACTSASNPTCAQPDRRTTVKYCLKGHDACVTKTYQTTKDKNSLVLIRDCGVSCDDGVSGYKFKSCKVCHSDVCNDEPFNGAFSIQGQSIMFTLFLIFTIKYTL